MNISLTEMSWVTSPYDLQYFPYLSIEYEFKFYLAPWPFLEGKLVVQECLCKVLHLLSVKYLIIDTLSFLAI